MHFATSPSSTNMTPTEAVNLLDRAASMANASRQDHLLIQQAVDELRAFIAKNTGTLETDRA